MAYAPGPQRDDKPGCRGVVLRSVALALLLAVVLARTVV